MSTAAAPLEIGTVRLTVNDLTKVSDFYARAIGLEKLGGDGTQRADDQGRGDQCRPAEGGTAVR